MMPSNPYSQMPAMTQNQGLLSQLNNPLFGVNGSIWQDPQNPGGSAQQPQAKPNPAPTNPNPNSALPQNPATMTSPGANVTNPNQMNPPGSPAPTPGTNPAIPQTDPKTGRPVQPGPQGNSKLLSAIAQPGKTSTGQKSGSLSDIAMQIMSMGAMGGGGGMAGM